METKNINPTQEEKSTKGAGGKFGERVGMAVAGAGMGAAATAFALPAEEQDEVKLQQEETPEPAVVDPPKPTDAEFHTETSQTSNHSGATPVEQPIVVPEEPDPITDNIPEVEVHETVTGAEAEITEVVEPTVLPEEEGEVPSEQLAQSSASSQPQGQINPDEVADAIIAEVQIDPNDLESEEIFNFEEIGTVYTVDGASYTAATFHAPTGEEFIVVDIDDDLEFDVITTPEGQYIADAGGITVSDAEIMTEDTNTYLASTEMQDEPLPSGENFMDDIINI
ncbi:MAG: hypothetical protein LBN06_10670 [Prevotellaceae bacterium]|nr:hypothetical protein [Prevotellaceae bacterium]